MPAHVKVRFRSDALADLPAFNPESHGFDGARELVSYRHRWFGGELVQEYVQVGTAQPNAVDGYQDLPGSRLRPGQLFETQVADAGGQLAQGLHQPLTAPMVRPEMM